MNPITRFSVWRITKARTAFETSKDDADLQILKRRIERTCHRYLDFDMHKSARAALSAGTLCEGLSGAEKTKMAAMKTYLNGHYLPLIEREKSFPQFAHPGAIITITLLSFEIACLSQRFSPTLRYNLGDFFEAAWVAHVFGHLINAGRYLLGKIEDSKGYIDGRLSLIAPALTLVVGAALEFMQKFGLMKGTFDPLDLVAITGGVVLGYATWKAAVADYWENACKNRN